MSEPKRSYLKVFDASEHNLQHIDVEIPHHAITVVTGVSGSGKSSLAYNVIFKESQRRFLESFSTYSRLYMGKLEKPKVKSIRGLPAALSIRQQTAVTNPRSTVGTMSGIYDYLRLLYARIGVTHCADCGAPISRNEPGNCQDCGSPQLKLQSKLFSFNSAYGACPECKGLGITEHIDPKKLVANEAKSLRQGALVPTTPTGYIVYSQVRIDELDKVCKAHGFNVDIPWKDLSAGQQHIIMYGSERIKILFGKHGLESRLKWKGITARPREEAFYKGMIPIMEDILHRDRNDNILRFASAYPCEACQGSRIRKEARAVSIDGKNISSLTALSLSELEHYLKQLDTQLSDHEISEHVLEHVFKRLKTLILLGLGYLTLSRESASLSGGEAQRIRLAAQVGSGLQGILYVLDEPSVGLHPRDNKKLLKVLKSLRDNGNTILVVEHDEDTIRAADYLVDIGPKAGLHGGQLIYQGIPQKLLEHKEDYPDSLTAESLSVKSVPKASHDIRANKGLLKVRGASLYNLKKIDVDFQLHAFNVVSGVSGAGKSTLVHRLVGNYYKGKQVLCGSFHSDTPIDRVIEIDQSPIGRTPRSNPATYTDLFDHIRELFARQEEAVARKYTKSRFSFNIKGGRCEDCQGAGSIQLGMHFLGDVEMPCEACEGKRFNEETLQINYRNKNIYEVLELSIEEAVHFFEGLQSITRILDQLMQLDLGYLKLGQPSTTLSGGEAQRVKLAAELYKKTTGHCLYILDEPSMGLHKADIVYLLDALNRIVDQGHTVIVIEHDVDIIKQADWIVDLGPEGGEAGGRLVVAGRPSDVINCKNSHTGASLQTAGLQVNINLPSFTETVLPSNIRFSGLSTHNLKQLDVEIPLHQTTVITGVSGSGKSSLAFDTIYAESRNRFTESLSSYARRMMSKMKKSEWETCYGLTPSIAIRQQRIGKNPRSTVGTITEIYDHLRLLYSRAGVLKDGSSAQLPAAMFSFNKIEAACPGCKGIGTLITADPERFITDPQRPLIDGAMDGSLPGRFFGDVYGQYINTLIQVGVQKGLDFSKPYQDLTEQERELALHGCGDEIYEVVWNFKRGKRTGIHRLQTKWKGLVAYINEAYEIKRHGKRGEAYHALMHEQRCPECHGQRLNAHALEVKFSGLSIAELSQKSISASLGFFRELRQQLSDELFEKIEHLVSQLMEKFKQLEDIGLGYISIDRTTSSLSGGESQRLRIASQLVTELCGLTYVLDEPTVGLHARDTQHLIRAIDTLRDMGNTVVVVEHDPDLIRHADHIIDMGPGAGVNGGRIVAQGTLSAIMANPLSLTGMHLKKAAIHRGKTNVLRTGIKVIGAQAHNLKQIDVDIPGGGLVAITGVSGSGKTSLAFDVIAPSFQAKKAVSCRHIDFHHIESLTLIDQQAIGSSPLSTVATYTGMFDAIRTLFANLEAARQRKFKAAHFSFNSPDGRCEVCKGMGKIKVAMDFLSDVWVNCESCHGDRYKPNVLEIRFQGLHINDVLNLEVGEALDTFKAYPKITRILQILEEVGLGYIKLGQATASLSGGETQRLKLAARLTGETPGPGLFIFDEPSTGLHMQDVERLIAVFGRLVDKGHSVLVVEHHLDIIRAADWILDLGPEGGDMGGDIVYSGDAAGILNCAASYTGAALKQG